MKKIKYIRLVLVVGSSLTAQDISTKAGRFLLLGGGARAGALGKAYSAVAEDATCIAWNPGGLGAVKAFEFYFMHMLYDEDFSYEYAASTIPLDFGTFGLNLIYMTMSPFNEYDEELDEIGILTGYDLNYSDMALSLSFGKEFLNTYGFGLSLKYIQNRMGIKDSPDYYQPSGMAADFGLLMRFNVLKFYSSAEKNLRIGAAVQNIAITKLVYDKGEFGFPVVIRPGLFYKPIKYAAFLFDYNLIKDTVNSMNAGIELLPEWILSPRAGIIIKNKLKTYTFGGGLKYNIGTFLLQFDYSFNMGTFFDTQMFSLAIRKFSASLAEFGIGEVSIQDIFPGMYKYYTKNPVASVEVRNNSNVPIKKVKVSMLVNKYMDFPSESEEISSLNPGRSIKVELPAEFNNSILKIVEDTPMQAQIKVDYYAEGKRLQLVKTKSFKLYNRYSMTWDDFDKLAAFVTPKDTPIRTFARGIVQKYSTSKIINFPAALSQAILVFNAVGALNLTYVLDPQSPFRQREDSLEMVDQIQYPRDTLRFKTGDCDDCAALYCALLQNIGLNTAFVDIKDHIFMAFDTQIPETEAFVKFGNKDLYFIKDGTAWLPVETTMFKKGFSDAWFFAANQYKKANNKGIATIIDVKKAWEIYSPVTLPPTQWESPFPMKSKVLNYFKKDEQTFNALGSKQIIDNLKSQLQKDPKNEKLLNKLGITYGLMGNIKESLKYLKQAVKKNPKKAKYYNNLANAYFLQNKLNDALKNYQKAIDLEPKNPNYKINLANLYAVMGEDKKAETEMEKAEELLSE